MENRKENNLVEVEPKKSGRGQYERKARGSYKSISEKKITVQHFLNTKINFGKSKKSRRGKAIFNPYESYSEPQHPLYLKIAFNGKMNFLRSATTFYCAANKLEEMMNENANLKIALQREIRFVEDYIDKKSKMRNEYFPYLQEDDIIKRFNYSDCLIEEMVNFALLLEIQQIAKDVFPNVNPNNEIENLWIYEGRDVEITQYWGLLYELIDSSSSDYPMSALELLNFLNKKDNKFNILKEMYPSDIWSFKCYNHISELSPFDDTFDGYNWLPPTLLDYSERNYKEFFLKHNKFRTDDAEKIVIDMEKLLKKGALLNFRATKYFKD